MKHIGFIGAGHMGSAIIQGIRKQDISTQIHLYELQEERRNTLQKAYDLKLEPSIQELCKASHLIYLAVKPDAIATVLKEIMPYYDGQIIVSMAAGITIDDLIKASSKDASLVRIMPNLGASMCQSMTAYITYNLKEQQVQDIKEELELFGQIMYVKEDLFDDFTAMCGSSPALYMYIMNAALEYGMKAGFSEEEARTMVLQTMKMSTDLIRTSGIKEEDYMNMIATKGGATRQGINVLEKKDVKTTWNKAYDAVKQQSKALRKVK
jgi:pyrroline-5-carboxylate reductase